MSSYNDSLRESIEETYWWEDEPPRWGSKQKNTEIPDVSHSVEEPGYWAGLIPVYGSGKETIHHFQEGNYVRAAFWGVMTVSDVFLIKSLLVGAGRLAVRAGTTLVEGVSETIAVKEGSEIAVKSGVENLVKKSTRRLLGKPPYQIGNLPEHVLGETSFMGDITVRTGLPKKVLEETLAHEHMHRILSPLYGPMALRELRASIKKWFYNNSHFLVYTEEALAETYATRNILKGLKFPLDPAYGLHLGRICLEGGTSIGAFVKIWCTANQYAKNRARGSY